MNSNTQKIKSNESALNVETQKVASAEIDERMLVALYVADEKKAQDTIVLDLTPVASFTDFFIITSGANQRQVQAIADDVVLRLKRMGTRVVRVEGYASGEWVLLDYGDFVMHIFDQKSRTFFDLERLWRDATRVAVKPELIAKAGTASEKKESSADDEEDEE